MPGQPCSKQLPPAALIALLESFRVGSSKQIRRASSSPRAVPCAICPLQTHPSRAASPRSSWAAACAWLHGTELGRERTTSPPRNPAPIRPTPLHAPQCIPINHALACPLPCGGVWGSPVTPGRWCGDAQPSARNCCSRHLSGSSHLSGAARQSSIPTLGPRDAAEGLGGEGGVNRVGHKVAPLLVAVLSAAPEILRGGGGGGACVGLSMGRRMGAERFKGARHGFGVFVTPRVWGRCGDMGDGAALVVVSFGRAARGAPGFVRCVGGRWGGPGVSGESSAGLRCRRPHFPCDGPWGRGDTASGTQQL